MQRQKPTKIHRGGVWEDIAITWEISLEWGRVYMGSILADEEKRVLFMSYVHFGDRFLSDDGPIYKK